VGCICTLAILFRKAVYMKLYTIGFAGKSAQEFFEELIKQPIDTLLDIRLKNTSHRAGFTKKNDLSYFLKKICNIEYLHDPDKYAPSEELFSKYMEQKINWYEYEIQYRKLLADRNILRDIDYSIFENTVLLCSEKTPEHCHRRLLAEYLAANNKNIEVLHL
jgi:uncharacterized protein (DUF488 family)